MRLPPPDATTATTEVMDLAGFVSTMRDRPLPPSVIEYAKRLILDAVGCVIGGAGLPAGQIASSVWLDFRGPPEATYLPSGARVPAYVAAYLHAHLNNLLDFDDTYSASFGGHPGATIVPAAIAAAERAGASGYETLLAVVAGYEVAIRMGLALHGPQAGPDTASRAWQIFGPAAAAAVLLRLAADEVLHALSLAGMNAPAPFMTKFHEPSGKVGWLKNNSGWIALGGLLAADLAARGMRGNRLFFDGDAVGVLGGRAWHPEALGDYLGVAYGIEAVSIKHFSACFHIQSTLEAIERLQSRRAVDMERIARVDVELTSALAARKFAFLPADSMDVPFSIPFLAALAFAGIPTGVAWFEPTRLHERCLLDLAQRVRVTARPSRRPGEPGTAATVTVLYEDGSAETETVEAPKGSSLASGSTEGAREKFRGLCTPVIGGEKTLRLESAILALERPGTGTVSVQRWLGGARGSSRSRGASTTKRGKTNEGRTRT